MEMQEEYVRYTVRMPAWLWEIIGDMALEHTRSLSGETVEAVKAYAKLHDRLSAVRGDVSVGEGGEQAPQPT
jgi:hypothetical protein